jgi:ABC-2 type transport system permease protein
MPAAPRGAVYDRGYRPYEGQRGGRREARLALLRLSVRRALGLRRSWRQKVLPWSLLAITTVPAVVNVGVAYLSRDTVIEDFDFFTFRDYIGYSTALLLFVALTAPDVVCPDRRNRVLPLIFARPLTGDDYVFAKVGAIAGIVFGFAFLPHVVLFVGQMFVDDDGALSYFTDNAEVLWQVPVSVAFLALHYAALGVALAATTNRRVVGGVSFLAVGLVTLTVAGTITEAQGGESAWALLNVLGTPLHLRDIVFLGRVGRDGPLTGIEGAGFAAVAVYVVTVVACLAFLRRRYAKVDV